MTERAVYIGLVCLYVLVACCVLFYKYHLSRYRTHVQSEAIRRLHTTVVEVGSRVDRVHSDVLNVNQSINMLNNDVSDVRYHVEGETRGKSYRARV